MFDFASGLLIGSFLGITGTLLLLFMVNAIPDGYPAHTRISKSWLTMALVLIMMVLAGYTYQWLNPRRVAFPALILLLLVFVAAKMRGLLISWLTLAFGAVVFSYVLPPLGVLRIRNTEDQVLLVLFVLCGMIGSRMITRNQEI